MNDIKAISIFLDGCPTDWLDETKPDRWHTIAFIVVPMCDLSALASRIERPRLWESSLKYRYDFAGSLDGLFSDTSLRIGVHALSYREVALRYLKPEFTRAHGIGFDIASNYAGKPHLNCRVLNFNGFSTFSMAESKLPLLLLAEAIIEHMESYSTHIRHHLNELPRFQIVTDQLSGDGGRKTDSRDILDRLICGTGRFNVSLTSVTKAEYQPANYLVDNLAGLLNLCRSNPGDELAAAFMKTKTHSMMQNDDRWTILSELKL